MTTKDEGLRGHELMRKLNWMKPSGVDGQTRERTWAYIKCWRTGWASSEKEVLELVNFENRNRGIVQFGSFTFSIRLFCKFSSVVVNWLCIVACRPGPCNIHYRAL